MKIHISYKAQFLECCHTCALVFELRSYDDWDGGPEYYCHADGSKRPACHSVLMDEASFKEKVSAWDHWSTDREVEPHGKCDLYKKEVSK